MVDLLIDSRCGVTEEVAALDPSDASILLMLHTGSKASDLMNTNAWVTFDLIRILLSG